MPVVSIKLAGDWRTFEKYIVNLPKNLRKSGNDISLEFAKSVKRRARRVLESSGRVKTGMLKNTIDIIKTTKGHTVIANAPYAWLQEIGFRTHFVPSAIIRRHYGAAGSTTLQHYSDLGMSLKDVQREGGAMITWKGPFMRPALERTSKDASKIIRRVLNRHLGRKK